MLKLKQAEGALPETDLCRYGISYVNSTNDTVGSRGQVSWKLSRPAGNVQR